MDKGKYIRRHNLAGHIVNEVFHGRSLISDTSCFGVPERTMVILDRNASDRLHKIQEIILEHGGGRASHIYICICIRGARLGKSLGRLCHSGRFDLDSWLINQTHPQ